MTVLSLVLAGPLQAWGTSSRFTSRTTDTHPSKSGVLGLLAAARGLRRTDPLEDLLSLRFAVRADQPGRMLRDFQTARSLDGKDTMPLSYRFYRADARYLVGLEGDVGLLEAVAASLRAPAFPLYLGRRSCPPSVPLKPQIHALSLEEFVVTWPSVVSTQVPPWRRPASASFTVDAARDAGEVREPLRAFTNSQATVHDVPESFDPAHRQYGWRTVFTGMVPLPEMAQEPRSHDPMMAV